MFHLVKHLKINKSLILNNVPSVKWAIIDKLIYLVTETQYRNFNNYQWLLDA